MNYQPIEWRIHRAASSDTVFVHRVQTGSRTDRPNERYSADWSPIGWSGSLNNPRSTLLYSWYDRSPIDSL